MFALIHSPLVGPTTWKLVAAQLEHQGYPVAMPTLMDSDTDPRALWEQHASSAAEAINALRSDKAWCLVGHSGAGPILPAIGQRLHQPPRGYIFVDAGLPQPGANRLEMMQAEAGQWAKDLEQHLIAGGRFPTWSDADLHSLIPDNQLREQVLKEINPRALAFFTEPISVPGDWALTPGGYVQFTEAYALPARQAQRRGWPSRQFQAGHFHMLVDAIGVTSALVDIEKQLHP